MSSRRRKQTYDHRLIRLVQETRDASIATRLGVPRSTAAGWLRRSPPEVVTARLERGLESGREDPIGVEEDDIIAGIPRTDGHGPDASASRPMARLGQHRPPRAEYSTDSCGMS